MVSIGRTKKLVVENVLVVGKHSEGDQLPVNVAEVTGDAFVKNVEYRTEGSSDYTLFSHETTPEVTLEAITGSENTLLPIRFLYDGMKASHGVCRILIRSDAHYKALGTGFIIGGPHGEFIMTNNHVCSDPNLAGNYCVQFGYEEGTPSRTFVCFMDVSDGFFITSKELDYTIFKIKYPEGFLDFGRTNSLRLLLNLDKLGVSHRCNIIGHPNGRAKEVALQKNTIVKIDDLVVHYTTDTEKGNSGSPVFDNNWNVFALHHAAGKQRQKVINLKKEYITNEGIRIDVIEKDVKMKNPKLHTLVWEKHYLHHQHPHHSTTHM